GLTAGNSDSVAEIPLLPETGRPEWIDRVIYVTADFGIRAERCRNSRGWTDDELRRREKFLLPQSERLRICDYVIRSENSLSELKAKAVKFLQEIEI
ncbi:MAG: dephospho-CoA kinase, partial [Synergistaceae bacterium]|nr:dephospho-CoA kinase [Synergistaceae bacterium]